MPDPSILSQTERHLLQLLEGRVPSAPNWPEIVRLASSLGVSSLLFHQAVDLAVSLSLPHRKLLARTAGREVAVVLRNLNCLKRLREQLKTQGVPAIFLKGSRSAYDLYQAPTHRVAGDIDLLILPQHLDGFVALLSELGYQPTWPDKSWQVANDYHARFVSKQGVVELHWQLGGAAGVTVEEVWARSVPLGSDLIRGLGREDRIVYLLHHVVKHAMNANLYQYLDIALLLQRESDAIDYESLRTLASAWGRCPGYVLVLAVIEKLFPSTPVRRLQAALDPIEIPEPMLACSLRCAMRESRGMEQLALRASSGDKMPKLTVSEDILRKKYRLGLDRPVTAVHKIRHLGDRIRGWAQRQAPGQRPDCPIELQQIRALALWLKTSSDSEANA